MEKGKEKDEQKVTGITHWMPIGMCLGCSFGILLDNLALGISLGMLLGVAVGTLTDSKQKDVQNKDPGNDENPCI